MRRQMRTGFRRHMVVTTMGLWLALGVVSTGSAVLGGCKPKVVRMDAVRDALVSTDSTALDELVRPLPTCPDAPPVALAPGMASPLDKGCLSEIATAFGSRTGFSPAPPDQAALTTAAVLVARDGRGDQIAHAEAWLGVLKGGKGVGADALRAAVSRAMVESAPVVGRRLETEADARAAMKAIAASIPGACPTYRLLGKGDVLTTLPPELGPDHAACVQRDLARREGPGPSYGAGIPRALEGALALWRETERALRLGAPGADLSVKPALDQRLPTIEAATQRISTERSTATVAQPVLDRMGELHAMAGIVLWKDAGAGDAGPDGGVPKGIPTAAPPAPDAAAPRRPAGDAGR